MDRAYQKERIKLTLLYLGIIMFIVAVFSYIVVYTQNQQFRKFDDFNENVRKIPARSSDPLDKLSRENVKRVDEIIRAIKRENLKSILILDMPLLIFASLLSYYLSGRTLEPILYTLEKQKRFVSDASHELKTPLTAIKTEAEVINRSKNTTLEEYKEFTSNVIDDVNRLDNLVTSLLDIARQEGDNFQVKKSKVNLVDLVGNIADKFRSVADTKSVKINFEHDREETFVNTDKNLLYRLISIIVDNGIKYNIDGGNLKLSIISKDSKHPVIRIKDTGVGIEKENIDKIFDRFYRVTEDRNVKGFGLGLSIASQLALDLNIDLKVKSKVGRGSTFSLIFN